MKPSEFLAKGVEDDYLVFRDERVLLAQLDEKFIEKEDALKTALILNYPVEVFGVPLERLEKILNWLRKEGYEPTEKEIEAELERRVIR